MNVFKLIMIVFCTCLFVQCGSSTNSDSKSDFTAGTVMKFQVVDHEFPDGTPYEERNEFLKETLGTYTVVEMFDNYIKETGATTHVYQKWQQHGDDIFIYGADSLMFMMKFNANGGNITGYDLGLFYVESEETKEPQFLGKMIMKRVE